MSEKDLTNGINELLGTQFENLKKYLGKRKNIKI